MKRAWMKKVKAVSTRAASDNALEVQSNSVRPKVKRRVRTSAAMIGIALSMGTSNLLITRQSDRTPAAEPTGHQPMVSTPTTQSATQGEKDLIEPEAVNWLDQGESASTLSNESLLNPQIQLKIAASASFTPARGAEQAVQKRHKQPTQSSQVNAATDAKQEEAIATANSSSGLAEARKIAPAIKASRPDVPAEMLEARRLNQLLQKLKQRQQSRTLSRSYKVERSQVSPSAVTTASQSLQAKELASNSGEVNHALSYRQKALINSLKQKPNPLRDRLIGWKAQQSNNDYAATTAAAKQISANSQKVQNNQAIDLPLILGTSQAQPQVTQRSPQAVTLNNSTALNLQQSQPTTSGVFVIPDVPNSAVIEPKVVTPEVLLNYQVKPGDTLIAIAKQHGMPLAELVKANKLINPNRIEINQKLQIPKVENNNAFVAQVPKTAELQANASGAIINNSATDSQQPNLAVSSESLTRSKYRYQEESFSGMGGNISDDDSVVPTSSSTIAKIQQSQSAVAKSQLQSNLYVQGLRTDIEKLRQKYSTQSTASQLLPQANATNTLVKPLQLPRSSTAANQPINPEFRAAQMPKNLPPAAQKQLSDEDSSDAPPRSKSSLATAPLGLDASESLDFLRGKQVSPELPPLGAADNYLPKPASVVAKSYIWPAKGKLTSGYGWRWGRMHKGIDIGAPVGTPIVAAAPGVVVKAGWNSGGYGNLVDIQHADGSLTRYAHNKKILVHTGQQIEQGQQISEMGSTGFSTGPHLHFEVHPLGKKAVNPIAFLPKK